MPETLSGKPSSSWHDFGEKLLQVPMGDCRGPIALAIADCRLGAVQCALNWRASIGDRTDDWRVGFGFTRHSSLVNAIGPLHSSIYNPHLPRHGRDMLQKVSAQAIVSRIRSPCDPLPRTHDPVDALLVIALDLLSQTEAQHRAARRLERATQLLADILREQGKCDEQKAHQVRQYLNAIRDMADGERTLLREFDRELHDWLSGIG
ncbi:MAG TPA: hypothetical protein VH458_10340 [Vicinamibacterales bacterium]|jgi:hypothetical protein